ncbi:MAG: hypothetical protein ACI855_001410 [Myxococcota bacterium]|jgi:hypothetical protein
MAWSAQLAAQANGVVQVAVHLDADRLSEAFPGKGGYFCPRVTSDESDFRSSTP